MTPRRGDAGAGTVFVPWPFPAGVGIGIGVVLGWALGGGASAHVAGLLVACGAVLAVRRGSRSGRRGRPPARPTRRLGPAIEAVSSLVALLPAYVAPVLLVAMGLGMYRLELHEAGAGRQLERVAPWFGEPTRWEGAFDGATFRTTHPVHARLTLVAHTEVPTGRLVVNGTARPAPGKRNPGGFDYAAHLQRRGVAGQLFVDDVLNATPIVSVRERLRRGVAAGLPPDLAALMVAMTLGLRDDLGTLRDTFTASGLAHLLSLSGLHFGVLLAAAARLLTRLGSRRVYVMMVLTVAFVFLVGTAPSVLRAAAMAMAALIGLATGVGRFEPWTVLMLAFTIGLVVAPQMLFDISLQLSYLALAGLLLFTRPLTDRWRLGFGGSGTPGARARSKLRTTVLGGLIVSAAAQLPSLSLVAGTFGTVPLVGPLVNVVAVPLAAAAVPLGFAAGLLGLVAEPLAWVLNRLTLAVARPITWLADVGARAPALSWGEVGWLGHVCWLAFVVAAALHVRGRLRLQRLLLVTLCAGGISFAGGPLYARPDVWFLDVGQGDAILIRLAGGYEVLIDGGGSPFSDDDVGRRVVVPALRALGVTSLELVVATHPDADHVEGLFSVLEELSVGTLVTGPEWPDNVLDQRLRQLAVRTGTQVHVARRGETIVLGGKRQQAAFEVLNPPPDLGGSTSNEASVVLLLRHRGHAVALFTGDSGMPTEELIFVPRVALLQAGHHGSRFSTGDHLLRATSPRVAVISVGENNYGHPHPDVLERLRAHDVPVYLTRIHGAVRLALAEGGAVTTMVGAAEAR